MDCTSVFIAIAAVPIWPWALKLTVLPLTTAPVLCAVMLPPVEVIAVDPDGLDTSPRSSIGEFDVRFTVPVVAPVNCTSIG